MSKPPTDAATMMKHLEFWFDPISPFAYLGFERLPHELQGLSYSVDHRPLLLAGLLQHWGQKGPAEIEPKRAWTFRQVAWLADRHAIDYATPQLHPFNPLALSRLLLATAPAGRHPNRHACETVLRHVWTSGADANDPQRLEALERVLTLVRDPSSAEVKQELRDSTAQAVQLGLFGVPTITVDGRAFWGLDALPMLAGYLRGERWFDGPDWDAAGQLRAGAVRSQRI